MTQPLIAIDSELLSQLSPRSEGNLYCSPVGPAKALRNFLPPSTRSKKLAQIPPTEHNRFSEREGRAQKPWWGVTCTIEDDGVLEKISIRQEERTRRRDHQYRYLHALAER